MNALDITVGRTAVGTLLVAVVVAAGVLGGVGTAAAEPMDGKGNDVPTLPPNLYASLDGKGNDVYPPPSRYSSDGRGNVAVTVAFPTDDVTPLSATYVGRGGGSGKPSF